MKYFRKYIYLCLLPFAGFLQQCTQISNLRSGSENSGSEYYTVDDFKSVDKIDVHMHVQSYADTVFIKQAEEDNFRILNLNVYKDSGKPIEEQQKFSIEMAEAFPGRTAWGTTFSLENFNNDGWQEEAIAYLKNSISKGAIAVKVWKNIGFFLKDKNGKLVMINNPCFDPILAGMERG